MFKMSHLYIISKIKLEWYAEFAWNKHFPLHFMSFDCIQLSSEPCRLGLFWALVNLNCSRNVSSNVVEYNWNVESWFWKEFHWMQTMMCFLKIRMLRFPPLWQSEKSLNPFIKFSFGGTICGCSDSSGTGMLRSQVFPFTSKGHRLPEPHILAPLQLGTVAAF